MPLPGHRLQQRLRWGPLPRPHRSPRPPVFTQLLDYVTTTLLFSDKNVDSNLIAWNRVVLLHGKARGVAPQTRQTGTGVSVCPAGLRGGTVVF